MGPIGILPDTNGGTTMAKKPANKTTSPRVASAAGDALRDRKSTARERELAGSDLSQAKPKPAPKPAAKPAPKPAAKKR